MNCREAQSEIFAERDGAPDNTRGAALDAHLALCADCRRVRADLTTALATWRTGVDRVTVPDAEREWHAVRRRIRGGAEAGATSVSRRRHHFFAWFAVPLGAAAAIAVTLFMLPTASTNSSTVSSGSHVARANSVDVPGNPASTMVFVDDKSGWLFVWANDANPKRG